MEVNYSIELLLGNGYGPGKCFYFKFNITIKYTSETRHLARVPKRSALLYVFGLCCHSLSIFSFTCDVSRLLARIQ